MVVYNVDTGSTNHGNSLTGVPICASTFAIILTLSFIANTGWCRETGKFEVDVGSPVDVQ
jgi:hypothetical protein